MHERLTEVYERRRAQWDEEHPPAQRDWLQPNPAAYALMGRSEGFAAAAGSTRVEPEHVLLGLLWDPQSVQTSMLRDVGTSRTEVYRTLSELGVPVPPIDLPPTDDRPRGERVSFPYERLALVLREVQRRLPEGSFLGFNFNHERTKAWVVATAEVDLQAVVDDILSGAD
jgi:hypothetical protein